VNYAKEGGDLVDESPEELVRRHHREAIERMHLLPPHQRERPTIPYTELPEQPPGSAYYEEWKTYRREVERLLAENQEGRFALIKGDAIVGVFDTREEADELGRRRFPTTPYLVKPIRSREPLVRVRELVFAWPF
jgi:hypothetical protein